MSVAAETAILPGVDPSLMFGGLTKTDQESWDNLRRSGPKPNLFDTSHTRAPQEAYKGFYRSQRMPFEGRYVLYYDASLVDAMSAPAREALRFAPWVYGDTDVKYYERLENSTARQKRPEEIDREIETLFEAAKEQYFEDGIESEFSRQLVHLVKKYGNDAVEGIGDLIINERVNPEIASEALRWLGHMDDPVAYHHRLHLLERSLYGSAAWVRDGAALGLAFLDDPHAIPYLKQAISRERCTELRKDMEQVLIQLENTRQCH